MKQNLHAKNLLNLIQVTRGNIICVSRANFQHIFDIILAKTLLPVAFCIEWHISIGW